MRAHAPVSMVVGDPQCCTEEGICHNVCPPLPDLQAKKLCGVLKMCGRLALLLW